MNRQPASSIKVTEMSKIKSINDDSVLLIVQNGIGHKVTFADLKQQIIEELTENVKNNTQSIKDLEQKQQTSSIDLKKQLKTSLDEFSNNIVVSARNSLERVKTQIQGNIQRYHIDSEQKFDRFKSDVDAKNLPNLFTKNRILSERLSSLEMNLTEKIDTLMTSLSSTQQHFLEETMIKMSELDEKIKNSDNMQNALTAEIAEIQHQITESISNLSSTVETTCSELSGQIDQLDINLYGLTIEDVDLDTALVTTTKAKVGDIEQLSAKIGDIQSKIESFEQMKASRKRK